MTNKSLKYFQDISLEEYIKSILPGDYIITSDFPTRYPPTIHIKCPKEEFDINSLDLKNFIYYPYEYFFVDLVTKVKVLENYLEVLGPKDPGYAKPIKLFVYKLFENR